MTALQYPVDLFVWLGQCGEGILRRIPGMLRLLGQGLRKFLRDVLHGILRILRLFLRILLSPVRLRNDDSRRILQYWHKAKDKGAGARFTALLRTLWVVLLGDHGILVTVYALAVPAVCCAFLWSVVRFGHSQSYGVAVTFNGQELGIVAQESDYTQAEQTVRRRLSYTEEQVQMDFRRSFRVETLETDTELLSPGLLADKMLESADISICRGFGVYVNNEFYGAVEDYHPIESALRQQLSTVSNSMDGMLDEIDYADTVTYEPGSYLASSLTDAGSIIEKFTQITHSTRIYTAGGFETPETAAMRFSTTKEKILELNPGLGEIIPQGTPVTVPVSARFLPIIFKRTFNTVSLIDYDTAEIETNTLPVGKQKLIRAGEKGERRNTVQATYSDGSEITRTLLWSQIIAEPVEEQIGVGTYTAKPASDSTVLTGSGRFSWPLDGGRISDHFGGQRKHRGIDLAAPLGTNIFAADDGVVRVASVGSSYGDYLIVDHQDGTETLYAHCSLLLATAGQEVKRGQIIAHVGSTGHSTGPHLHFEVRVNGLNFDPAMFLRVNAGD